MTPGAKANLLIVDDEPSICLALCHILIDSGYTVRAAEDGFSALAKIRQEIPDILLSDLNMPGMSGLELLSVVSRRFPAMQAIAMSGTFSGGTVPPGVCADAFYAKGTHPDSLLQLLATMTHSERRPSHPHRDTPAAIWIPSNGHHPLGEAYVMITCPECMRTFPWVLNEPLNAIHEAICVHCYSSIQYAIVQPQFRRLPWLLSRSRTGANGSRDNQSQRKKAGRRSYPDARHSRTYNASTWAGKTTR